MVDDDDDDDAWRLKSLMKEHGLRMRVQGGLWYFDDLEWRAASMAEALAFAEGYDRCIGQRLTSRIKRMLSKRRP